MAAVQPLMAVHWSTAEKDRYTLTSRGKLFVEYALNGHPDAKHGFPPLALPQEVELKALALKTVYQELARHIPPIEEPQP